jgi:hypothetical protein
MVYGGVPILIKWRLHLTRFDYVTSIESLLLGISWHLIHPSIHTYNTSILTMAMLIPILLPHVVAAGANIGMTCPLIDRKR